MIEIITLSKERRHLVFNLLNQVLIPLIFYKFYKHRLFYNYRQENIFKYWIVFVGSVGSFYLLNAGVFLKWDEFTHLGYCTKDHVGDLLRMIKPNI